MAEKLFQDCAALDALCRHHGIARIALFGSELKGTARPDSDVDLLVAFAPGREPGLFKLAAIEAELSTLLNGRRVDLRTEQDLSPHFRGEVVAAATEQYAA
jgi:predicted nucleotidyltransferase